MGAADHPRFEVGHKALIVSPAEHRLLLVREAASGLWELPGGRIGFGEESWGAREVLARELAEELGPAFRWRLLGPALTWVRPHPDGRLVFLVGWRCAWEGGDVVLSEEHDACVWAARDDVVAPLAPGYDDVLRRVRSGAVA